MSATNESLYLEELSFNQNNFKGLRESYEKLHGKYITRHYSGKYEIRKTINGKIKFFGSFDTFHEAQLKRDQLIENNWEYVGSEEMLIRKYFQNLVLKGNRYVIMCKGNYYGGLKTIEEALYYRDILKRNDWKPLNARPKDYDLRKNNPYLTNGFDYPLPSRLKKKEKEPTGYGKGFIEKRGPQSYRVGKGKKYFGSYRTYELAYYVREEMNKCGWDKNRLSQILDDYPVWYTWLNNFYQYVIFNKHEKTWLVSLTEKNNPDKKLEQIRFKNLEDALWERDLLIKYDWNEELLIECADDNLNPYYDMVLPPYPQRKVRRLCEREDRTDLFKQLSSLILDGITNQEELSKIAGISSATLRNILKKEFNTTFSDFKTLVLDGENPWEVLEQQPVIYNPNLDRDYKKYGFFRNYVSHYPKCKSPYRVIYEGVDFGAYPTRELADKISNAMQKINWDKSRLKQVQAKFGHQSIVGSKNHVYENRHKNKNGEVKIYGYSIRKKNKDNKTINYGHYKDKKLACLVRDLLILYDWDKSKLKLLQDYANTVKRIFLV